MGIGLTDSSAGHMKKKRGKFRKSIHQISISCLAHGQNMLFSRHRFSHCPFASLCCYITVDPWNMFVRKRNLLNSLKGQCHEIFCFWFFSWISFPQAPEYTIRAVLNFSENSRRYSQLKVDHRYQRHRWKNFHRCQRHRRQILPPVLLVLLIPVANNGNNIRLQMP